MSVLGNGGSPASLPGGNFFASFTAGTYAVSTFARLWGAGVMTSATEGNQQCQINRTGLLKNLRVRTITGTVSVADATFVVRVNGIDTTLTAIISSGSSSGSDLSNTVSVTPGDLLSIAIAGSGTTIPASLACWDLD